MGAAQPDAARRSLGRGGQGATRRQVLVLLLAAGLAARVRPARADPAAIALIEAFHAEVIRVMQEGRALGFAGRVRNLTPAVARTFDYPTMTRVAAGNAWAGMTADEQAQLIDAFRAYGVANYAANFDDYAGQSFQTLAAEPSRGNRLTIRTQLVRAPGRGAPVSFDYLVHPTAEGWRAIDVVVDGKLSELARRRSEFAGILRRGGVAELLRVLRAETQALGA